MDSRAEEILRAFPGLRYDDGFSITSPEDADYNCIAWAFGRKDCWMWPDEQTDGVSAWPQGATDDMRLQTFVSAFRSLGYNICQDDTYEAGKEKIALYAYPDSEECTHAAPVGRRSMDQQTRAILRHQPLHSLHHPGQALWHGMLHTKPQQATSKTLVPS
ncbi:MAG: hypothetical protein K6B13_07835 [Prevotella sp.]|nr:hypothetical protein [Prevotella sp.]